MPVFSVQADPYRSPGGGRLHDTRKSHHPVGTQDFIAVDGEGITLPNGEHRYVLLGVGEHQIENPNGLHWEECFEFLYSQRKNKVAFVGFYLQYDFTQILKTLPQERAWKLLTIEGKESRRSKSEKMKGKFLPVDVDDWQLDVIGNKRLSIRPRWCQCETVKCAHKKASWLHICDAGPFFQTSFLNVIKPSNWQEPIISDEEYATILQGKNHRATAELDDDMRFYNRLENEILVRVMKDLDEGFRKLDVNLSAGQWYGPGQAAQSWLAGRAPRQTEIAERVPEWFTNAAQESYYGGWFEIMAHGTIPGKVYENDINSAYPHIIATLPCLLHGTYSQGVGKPPPGADNAITLVKALVWSKSPHSVDGRTVRVGAMLHRDEYGRISRPVITAGWFWLHELQSSQRAGFITRISANRYYEWVRYTPCDCPPPIYQIKYVYEMRQQVGKKTSLGKSAKLIVNSCYGKFAQSTGTPRYGNPIYASLITAGCRTMITDAIASHPKGSENVVMVATDGVYFLDPHPLLTYGSGLGEWEQEIKENITLFKPGVYWDDTARRAITKGEAPAFKARGVNARDLAGVIHEIDAMFASWDDNPPSIEHGEWPKIRFTTGFAMTTALQALTRNDWETAGYVEQGKELTQSANPSDKRQRIWVSDYHGRRIYRSSPLSYGSNATARGPGNIGSWRFIGEESYYSVPYAKRFGFDDPFSEESTTEFGITPDENRPLIGVFRLFTGKE